MTAFPGCTRRVFIRLEHGAKAHLLRRRTKRTGAQTWCGHLDGEEIGWRDAKDSDLCGTCASVSGLTERLSA